MGRRALYAVCLFLLLGLLTISLIREPHQTSYLKGKKLAGEMGCFACHGPGGNGTVPNPEGDGGDVPPWSGGMAMMYLEKDEHIKEYILYGKRKDKEMSKGLLQMPAYEGQLSEDELNDLTHYVKVVSNFFPKMPDDAIEGYDLSAKMGCFGCHGPGGYGGTKNPGSFKGVIPGWDGDDYEESVSNKEELREWILKGTIERFVSNPLAIYFLKKQILQMPAYMNSLKEEDIQKIETYINWMREHGSTL